MTVAIQKPTTKADLTKPAVDTAPGYVTVTSPTGFVTEVPESIAQSLLDSGYSKSK